MNTLLLYFAIPILVIIVSIILGKLINNPILVASLVFAVFSVITFALEDTTLLIVTLIYTLIALITAVLVKLFCCFRKVCNLVSGESEENNTDNNETLCDVLTETIQNNNTSNNTCNNAGCTCNRHRPRRF